MPSANKLPNTGLNQWILTDKPVMEDFNRDNELIDAMAGHLKKTPYIGPDLYWYVWDTDKGEYTKTDCMAQGEAGPVGPQGVQGPKGATGEKGETGAGFQLLGLYDSEEALKSAHPDGLEGDAYAVGTAAENTVFVWSADDSTWKNIGKLQGPQGVQGPEGPQGEQGPQGPQGSPSVINGKEPDENGAITLSAADVGALAESWKPNADDITETDSRKFMTAGEKAAIAEIAGKAGKSKLAKVTLPSAGWVEDVENGWWTQAVSNPAIVDGRKVDITFSAAVTMQLMEDGASIMVVNDGGAATAYAFGSTPTVDIAGQIEIREVSEE